MRTRPLVPTLLASMALLGCREAPKGGEPSPASGVVLGTFMAEVNAAAGTLTLHPGRRAPAASAALVELPVVQDGHPGTGPADTLELVTEGVAGAVAEGCGPGLTSFEGSVRVRSFFATSLLRNVHVELTAVTQTGFEACNSAYPVPEPGTGRGFGLFPYGTLSRAGTGGDSALATWKFRFPSATSFTFWGRVVGEVVPVLPPHVTATSPANGTTASAGVVTVTFSEPMDPVATAAAITLTGPGGAVAGTVAGSQGNQVFTFTPASPFVSSTSYTVGVGTSAVDPLGASLAAPFAATFTTGPQLLSGRGGGVIVPGGLAFDRDGNGLLVWGSRPLSWSYLSASTGTWSEPVVLDASGYGASVAASATQLAVAWRGAGGLKVALFTNGIPGAATVLQDEFLGSSHAVASNGAGFAVAWAGIDGTFAAIWDGVRWSPSTFLWPDPYASGIAVASDGAGYRAIWIAGPGAIGHLGSATYSGGWWYAGSLGSSATAVLPALAVSPTTTCIAWSESGASGTTLRVERGGISTSTTGFRTSSPIALSAAVVGDRCQVAGATSTGVFGAFWDASAWTASESPLGFASASATAVAVVPLGTGGFAVFANVGGHVQVSRSDGWSFGGPAATVDTGDSPPRSMIAAATRSGAHVVYAQAGATADEAYDVRVDAAAIGAPAALPITPGAGSAANVRVAAGAGGEMVSVWEQQDLGTWNVYWARRTGGAWGPPQLLAAAARSPVVASNGSDFMLAWTATAGAWRVPAVFARRLVGGAWAGAAVVVATGIEFGTQDTPPYPIDSPLLASDGTGYALTYYGPPGVFGAIHANGAWLPRQLLSTSSTTSATRPQVAGRPGEYLFAWTDTAGVAFGRAAWNGTAWAWDAASSIIGSSGTPAVAAGPDGFAVVYGAATSPYGIAARLVTGGVPGAATVLRSGPNCGAYGVASSGTTYLVATGCQGNDDLLTHAYSGGWQPPRIARATASVLALAVASDGTGYEVLADGWSGGGGLYAIAVPEPVAGAPGAPLSLGAGSGDGEHGALAGSGGGFVAAWKQGDPVEPQVMRIYARDL
jgi:hypothetical protein